MMSSAPAIIERKLNMRNRFSLDQELQRTNVQLLLDADREEVLEFLSHRPIHTVCMAGYILDHGMVSNFNRGTFYGYRNASGSLTGVALIGHATLIETESDEALQAFARLKHQFAGCHVVRGEHDMISQFWRHYAELGHEPRLACRELLFESEDISEVSGHAPELRPATLRDLLQVLSINAEMVRAECGVDPLLKDPKGFQERLVRRIEQGRVWVWINEGRLVFKADVFAQTPEMVYLEGINVHPRDRGKGYGVRCLSQLSGILLQRSKAICLLLNERRKSLRRFYEKAGYEFRGFYDTIYLQPD